MCVGLLKGVVVFILYGIYNLRFGRNGQLKRDLNVKVNGFLPTRTKFVRTFVLERIPGNWRLRLFFAELLSFFVGGIV